MFTIMALAVDKRAPKGVFGFAIGATYTFNIIAFGAFTGGAMNPFRHYGPIIGTFNFKKIHWIYAVGPF